VIVLTIAAPTAAPATVPSRYGGGEIGARATKPDVATYAPNTAIGLRRQAGGTKVGVRVSFALACGVSKRGDWRSTDARAVVALAPDGTFHGTAKDRTSEMGDVTVTVAGTLGLDRADGTVQVRTHFPCGGQVRTWSARPVDPAHPPSGTPPAPVDGVLYGLTGQDPREIPHGFVARVTAGGTVAHAFFSYGDTCKGRDRKGSYTFDPVVQELLLETPIAASGWRDAFTVHETKAEHRRHVDFAAVHRWSAVFAGPALAGTFSHRSRLNAPRNRYTCATGSIPFVAV
jgi:hypothetical protein